jgi:hypothetical protein
MLGDVRHYGAPFRGIARVDGSTEGVDGTDEGKQGEVCTI